MDSDSFFIGVDHMLPKDLELDGDDAFDDEDDDDGEASIWVLLASVAIIVIFIIVTVLRFREGF